MSRTADGIRIRSDSDPVADRSRHRVADRGPADGSRIPLIPIVFVTVLKLMESLARRFLRSLLQDLEQSLSRLRIQTWWQVRGIDCLLQCQDSTVCTCCCCCSCSCSAVHPVVAILLSLPVRALARCCAILLLLLLPSCGGSQSCCLLLFALLLAAGCCWPSCCGSQSCCLLLFALLLLAPGSAGRPAADRHPVVLLFALAPAHHPVAAAADHPVAARDPDHAADRVRNLDLLDNPGPADGHDPVRPTRWRFRSRVAPGPAAARPNGPPLHPRRGLPASWGHLPGTGPAA